MSDSSFPVIVAATIVRWCGLLALAIVIGGFALELLVLPPCGELAAARRRLRRWGTLALAILVITTAAALVMRTSTMSGGEFAGMRTALPIVLTRTHFGVVWMGRAVALGLLLIVSFISWRPLRITGLLLSLGVALTTTLTGHAADWGDRSIAVLADWVHAVAAAIWVGGLFGMILAVFEDRSLWPIELFSEIARRFSRLAGYCLLAVVMTGAYNVWIQVPDLSALWATVYGGALLAKLALTLALASMGCVNRYLVLPDLVDRPRKTARWIRLGRLAMLGPWRGRAPASTRLARFVACEALIAIAVLGCTAVLGESTPKRHAGHVSHAGGLHQGVSFHVTMDDLHATGGVPRGWALTLPAGDPTRGREVFGRLECFTCHAISGEKFPRPSRPGPALTDVGGHHPDGYLLESILNPNAVIVEAPGYTGLDGRSTMPDYRDSLSVNDLVDLVAYLKSLGG